MEKYKKRVGINGKIQKKEWEEMEKYKKRVGINGKIQKKSGNKWKKKEWE
jgi:hypothetical protein